MMKLRLKITWQNRFVSLQSIPVHFQVNIWEYRIQIQVFEIPMQTESFFIKIFIFHIHKFHEIILKIIRNETEICINALLEKSVKGIGMRVDEGFPICLANLANVSRMRIGILVNFSGSLGYLKWYKPGNIVDALALKFRSVLLGRKYESFHCIFNRQIIEEIFLTIFL